MPSQLYRRLCGKPSPTATATTKLPSSPLCRFSYGQLRCATSAFAPSRKLGQGGFGPVFRGLLPSGQEVAVKTMESSGSLQGDREFYNELALAARLLTLPSSDRKSVVVPFGYCFDEGDGENTWDQKCLRWWKRKTKKKTGDDSDSDDGLGRRGRVMLVYDLMHNGSVQDALLDRRCPELVLEWACRFSVALDITRGLQFLHAICDPPVVHGDIKPSNILLDSNLSAKIADFGLAYFQADDTTPEDVAAAAGAGAAGAAAVVVVDIEPIEKKEKNKELVVSWGGEDDAASLVMITTAGFGESGAILDATNGIVMVGRSPDNIQEDEGIGKSLEGDELTSSSMDVASTSEANGGCDRMSVDSGREVGASSSRKGAWKKSGGGGMFSVKDWGRRRQRQDNGNTDSGGGSGSKDYVMEWIKSEIKGRPKSNWMTSSKPVTSEDCLMQTVGRLDRKKEQRRSEWWSNLDEDGQIKKKKNRPAREWWREEFCEELTKKSETSTNGGDKRHWWKKDENCALPPHRRKKKKIWNRSKHGSMEWGMDDLRRRSHDWTCGGEVPKSGATVSSTPSMRGTVCYVAPEYGGGGPISEKCDIYSFGVLLLVLISGRRPLQVIASPISEFERANLISWARFLARSRRLLDLVDPALREMDTDQVLLCIKVALLCIQRSPARRPSINEIMEMLTGQSEPPLLPMEFSPSPPGGYSFKSRKKTR